jgi:hypothetical protein
MDYMNPGNIREGVKWLPEKGLDVLFVTLNKSDKDNSPTTMYKDYSINESLFHWQSQAHGREFFYWAAIYKSSSSWNKVLLFGENSKRIWRERTYTFLGLSNYNQHTGSRPMSLTWQLERPIPAKYLKKTNKLVVG